MVQLNIVAETANAEGVVSVVTEAPGGLFTVEHDLTERDPTNNEIDAETLELFKNFAKEHHLDPALIERLDPLELSRLMVRVQPDVLRLLDPPLLTRDLCKLAFSLDATTVIHIPEPWLTREMVLRAIEVSEFIYPCLTDRVQRIPEVAEAAFQRRATMYEYLPVQLRTPERTKKALEVEPTLIRFVPPEQVTEAMLLHVVEACPTALGLIHLKKRSPAVCRAAVAKSAAAYALFPEALRRVGTPLGAELFRLALTHRDTSVAQWSV